MNNWQLLNDLEYAKAWNFLYEELHFSPFESYLIILPDPKKDFDISKYYDDGFSQELYDDLHKDALFWLKKVSKGKRIFALNWQHDCYSFNTDLPFEKDEFDEWLVPVFPNGDYIFFMTNDFSSGIFADGINLKLSIWGEALMRAFECKKPEMLSPATGG